MRAELRVRPEDQVDARRPPPQFVGLAVAAFVGAVGDGMPLRLHGEQVDEEVVRQDAGPVGEDAVLGASGIRTENAQAAEKHRHLRRGQRQQLRPVDQRLLRLHELLAAEIVAEAVGTRLERGEGLDVGLLPATRPCARG